MIRFSLQIPSCNDCDQVHEMEESQSEDTESEQSVDDFVVRGPSRTQILRNSNRVWNENSAHPYSKLYPPSLFNIDSSKEEKRIFRLLQYTVNISGRPILPLIPPTGEVREEIGIL